MQRLWIMYILLFRAIAIIVVNITVQDFRDNWNVRNRSNVNEYNQKPLKLHRVVLRTDGLEVLVGI